MTDLRNFKDELIIIKRFGINENDSLITAFAKQKGKITVKARGAKKTLSQFTGKIEPLTIIKAQIYDNNGHFSLTNAEEIFAPPLAPDLETFHATQFICQILIKSLPAEEANLEIFDNLKEILLMLKNGHNPKLLLTIFLCKYLDNNGHLPEFNICGMCDQKLECGHIDTHGRLTCKDCSSKNDKSLFINLDELKVIHFFKQERRIEKNCKLQIPKATLAKLESTLKNIAAIALY